jgi:hypothetical protein
MQKMKLAVQPLISVSNYPHGYSSTCMRSAAAKMSECIPIDLRAPPETAPAVLAGLRRALFTGV